MSQATDYELLNQSGANFRTELNSVLAAAVSQNSGSGQPSTMYPYMLWVNTGVSPARLELRNGANSGWITVGDVTAANLGLLTSTLAASTYLALAGGTVTGELLIGTAGSLVFEGSSADANETTLAVTNPTADRTITLPDASLTVAGINLAQTFTAAQRGTISALTDGATITPDFAVANNFSVTLGGNRTLANPSNLTAGQSGAIWVTQDGSGGRSVSYDSYWDFTGGTPPNMVTTANAVNCIVYAVQSSTRITTTLITNLN
jgi:hypothetical protein